MVPGPVTSHHGPVSVEMATRVHFVRYHVNTISGSDDNVRIDVYVGRTHSATLSQGYAFAQNPKAANVVKLVAGGKNAIFHVNVERDIRAMMTLENAPAEMKLFVIQLIRRQRPAATVRTVEPAPHSVTSVTAGKVGLGETVHSPVQKDSTVQHVNYLVNAVRVQTVIHKQAFACAQISPKVTSVTTGAPKDDLDPSVLTSVFVLKVSRVIKYQETAHALVVL